MKLSALIRIAAIAYLLMFNSVLLKADQILVATASNFVETIRVIARNFEAQTGHEVLILSGSTGKHYAQIKHGAPFDVFFAADIKRPELLEKEGIAIPDSRFTYAIGKLTLWSPKTDYVDSEGKILAKNKFRHLAIANPKLAPYGKAAQNILQNLGLWQTLQTRMVRGENIGQTFQFVKSSNAQLGFVSVSQITKPDQPTEGSFWEIPQSLYTPIQQQAVLLKDSNAARTFIAFVKNKQSQQIIRSYGYGVQSAH